MAKWRFLTPHYINEQIYPAGAIAEVPATWMPTPEVEPLDEEAVALFFRCGPRDPGDIRFRAATRWQMNSAGKWKLTGLGAHLGEVMR
jgi:hypothetical protein